MNTGSTPSIATAAADQRPGAIVIADGDGELELGH